MALLPAVMVLLGLAACRSDCASEVTGGTSAERREVNESVQSFLDLLAPRYSLCVPSVKVVDVIGRDEDISGQYSVASRSVRLVETRAHVVYHELCHALERQNDVPVDDLKWTIVNGYPLASGDMNDPGREAFALACEFGPGLAQLLDPSCPTDEEGLSVYDDAQSFFTGPDESIDLSVSGVFHPTVTIGSGVESFELRAASTGVVIDLDQGDRAVDPWTGRDLIPEGEMSTAGVMAVHDDEWLILMAYEAPNGARGERRVIQRNGRYGTLGCTETSERVFVYDDRFWSAFLSEGSVVIGNWSLDE